MTQIKQNIDEMHQIFGKSDNYCKKCKYLFLKDGKYHCSKWGEHSEWSTEYLGCNLWERKFNNNRNSHGSFSC